MGVVFSDMDQRFAFVNALVYIASSDERITEEERTKITSISRFYGIEDGELINKILFNAINKEVSIGEILRPISERKAKILLINELISFCFIDGEYSEKERNIVHEISTMLHIENEKVLELEQINNDSITANMNLAKALEI